MDESHLEELETLFLALADKTRLRLLALMAGGEVPVGFLADRLGESQPKISRHLAYLRSAGIVSTRRDGKWIYYDIDEQVDESVHRVLKTVLASMAGGEIGDERTIVRSANPSLALRNDAQADIYTESHMTNWRPNDLEIYLL